MSTDDKIERWAQRELARNLDNIIIQDADGKVFAFGRYMISGDAQGAHVLKNDDEIAVFTSKATALCWCVADQHNLINLARRIRLLDSNKRMLQQDITVRRISADRSRNADFRERVITKISSKQMQLDLVREELGELMSQAKYVQLQGLQNETSRTRRA